MEIEAKSIVKSEAVSAPKGDKKLMPPIESISVSKLKAKSSPVDPDLKFINASQTIRYKVHMKGKVEVGVKEANLTWSGSWHIIDSSDSKATDNLKLLPFSFVYIGEFNSSISAKHTSHLNHSCAPGIGTRRESSLSTPAWWGYRYKDTPLSIIDLKANSSTSSLPAGRWAGYFNVFKKVNAVIKKETVTSPSKSPICHESFHLSLTPKKETKDIWDAYGTGSNVFGPFVLVGEYNQRTCQLELKKIYTRSKSNRSRQSVSTNVNGNTVLERRSRRQRTPNQLLNFEKWENLAELSQTPRSRDKKSSSAQVKSAGTTTATTSSASAAKTKASTSKKTSSITASGTFSNSRLTSGESRKRKRSDNNQSSSGIRRKYSSTAHSNEKYGVNNGSTNWQIPSCHVCDTNTVEKGNCILICSRCNVPVHQSCYGILEIPLVSRWFCRPCLYQLAKPKKKEKTLTSSSTNSRSKRPNNLSSIIKSLPQCALCPISGGAMKLSRDGNWVHIICALLVPEVIFVDMDKLAAVGSIKTETNTLCGTLEAVPSFRLNLLCSICHTSHSGACIQCCVSGCDLAMHPLCARNEGLFISINPSLNSLKGYEVSIKCSRHSNIETIKAHVTAAPSSGAGRKRRSSNSANTFVSNSNSAYHNSEIPYLDYNGDAYQGQMKDGLRHGAGTVIYAHGNMYQGNWKKGSEHGSGVLSDAYDVIVYQGEFQDGYFQGRGKYFYENGDVYDGDWKEGLRHGKGTYIYSDGAYYRGEWRDNLRHGKGRFATTDYNVYIGDWKYDCRDGKGVLDGVDGLHFEGAFKRGLIEGRGMLSYADGSRYEGMFRHGCKDGRGTLIFPNEAMYEGHFRDDKVDGRQGTFTMGKSVTSHSGEIMIPIVIRGSLADVHKKAGFDEYGR